MSDLESMTVAELKAAAEARGVLPESGSGAEGSVLKKDLMAALEAVQKPERYQYGVDYVLVAAHRGYEAGDVVCNWPRSLGQAALDNGMIERA